MHRPFVLHVGLPKTGTTLLQSRLFARHTEVAYFGKFPDRAPGQKARDAETEWVYDQLVRKGMHASDLAACRRWHDNGVVPAAAGGCVPVLSYEGIARGSATQLRKRAENFCAVLGPCRVMITLRHPLRLIESVYFQNLKSRWFGREAMRTDRVGFLEMEDWIEAAWRRPQHGALAVLNYFDCVEAFASVFGKDNVAVFLYETLVAEPRRFVQSVCRFAGIDEEQGWRLLQAKRDNVRWSRETIDRMRRIAASPLRRKLFQMAPLGLKRRMLALGCAARRRKNERAQAEIPAKWRRRIENHLRAPNRRLAADWRLPLAELGYPM